MSRLSNLTRFLTASTAVMALMPNSRSAGAQVYTAFLLGPTGADKAAAGFGFSPNGTKQVGEVYNSSGIQQAALWKTAGSTAYTNITPTSSSYAGAVAVDSDSTDQTGYALFGTTSSNVKHAGFWSGTAASFVDLNPGGTADSQGTGIASAIESGYENVGTEASPHYNAGVWTGTAASFVNLNGSFYSSEALDTSGATTNQEQAGWANASSGAAPHAIVWSGGSAASPLDLNSTGSNTESIAFGINNNDVVGERQTSGGGGNWRAAYWSISNPASPNFTALNPSIGGTWTSSIALATRGGEAVGYGVNSSGVTEAVLWTGFAASDALVLPIPTGYTATYAYGLDSFGDVVGYGIDSSGVTHAILWATPAPEGLNVAVIGAIPGAFLMIRRRKGRRRPAS